MASTMRPWTAVGKRAPWDERLHPRDRIGRFARAGSPAPALSPELVRTREHNTQSVDRWWDGLDATGRAEVRRTIASQAAKQARINLSEEALRSVLAEGRFKTLHEVAPDQARQRRDYESAALGVRDDTPASDLPVYGFAGDALDLDAYGAYSVVLSDAARARATATAGDSLNNALAPQPLDGVGELDDEALKGMIAWSNARALAAGSILDYLEIQVVGVALDDIVAVTVPGDAPDDLRRALQERGIAVEDRAPDPEELEIEALLARLAAAGAKGTD